MAVAAKLAATLVAVTLTGVPRVAAMHAPVKGHVCTCSEHAGGHHQCTCVLCRRAALAAKASDHRLLPCCRSAARKELAAEEARDTPCLPGTCGDGAQPFVTAAGVEPFCLPPQPILTLALVEEARPQRADPARERALEPETPPPRPA